MRGGSEPVSRYPYDDPARRPPYGEDSDWGYDNLFCTWVYVGEDEELEKRWHTEMDLVDANEWDYERPHPASNHYFHDPAYDSCYDPVYERPAKLTVWCVVVVCVAIAVVLLSI